MFRHELESSRTIGGESRGTLQQSGSTDAHSTCGAIEHQVHLSAQPKDNQTTSMISQSVHVKCPQYMAAANSMSAAGWLLPTPLGVEGEGGGGGENGTGEAKPYKQTGEFCLSCPKVF